jgi:hypothetical protein
MVRAEEEIERMNREVQVNTNELAMIKLEITKSENDMDKSLEMRNEERKIFEKSVKDDTAAIAILNKALDALVAFYERNKIPMLVQKNTPREYTVDADKAPETSWDSKGADYTGAKSENEGVTAILSMIIEDVEKEVNEARKDDQDAQAAYENDLQVMQDSHQAQLATKAAIERKLQELDQSLEETGQQKDSAEGDLGAATNMESITDADCHWVDGGFEKRKEMRKREMDGLVAAKSYLAGVAAGTEIAP